MSEIAATTVHEAYSFACMRCGHGWEQAYEIEHHVDASNNAFVVYKADGQRVPSPLSTPTCANCGGHVVRIMRSGRVSNVQQLMRNRLPVDSNPVGTPAGGPADAVTADARERKAEAVAATAVPGGEHHWHLADLLHPFHRK
ncbi:hypothetical protein AB0I93_27550 [Streptomyces sp. NPDC049967]|uniref:hypothetical protein n=1 Tax=unclassified Streptomyces TaxID=2593676 RepID=UPI002E16787A|nr:MULTISPECIES: hypothetical protein [unclassified Streptomyces]WSJ23059.1 hypothetical protein OG384_14230 [Streptomyces sp. NBC_01324]